MLATRFTYLCPACQIHVKWHVQTHVYYVNYIALAIVPSWADYLLPTAYAYAFAYAYAYAYAYAIAYVYAFAYAYSHLPMPMPWVGPMPPAHVRWPRGRP